MKNFLGKTFPNYGFLRINTTIFRLWSNKYVIKKISLSWKIFLCKHNNKQASEVETLVCQWF